MKSATETLLDYYYTANSRWHKPALQIFMVIVLAHWAEHLAQAWQVYVLGWPRHHAGGVLGLRYPWLEQLRKLQRGMERIVDSYSEEVIDKEQFMSRVSRTKSRIAELEARIHATTEGADRRQEFRFLVDHFRKLAVHLGPTLENADWNRRREMIRSLVERIEIGRVGIVIIFRLPHGIAAWTKDPIAVTLSRA